MLVCLRGQILWVPKERTKDKHGPVQRWAYDPDDPDDARGGFAEADIQAQLARVRGSAVFARAHRLSNLLASLVEHSASGRGRDLHEANIGIELFGRGSDFDCQSDTIVRVSVRRLRDRLGDYYRGDGSADPIRFEIPKGRYRVLFHPGSRAAVTTTPPALTASPAPTTAPDPPPAPAVRSGGKRRIPRSAAALVMAGVVAVFILAPLVADMPPGPRATLAGALLHFERGEEAAGLPFRQAGVVAGLAGQEDDP
jgi:hypothetical protein